MLFGRNDAELIDSIRNMRLKADAQTLSGLIAEAQRYRPPPAGGLSYDEFVEITRLNYLSHQRDRTEALLRKRYPGAWQGPDGTGEGPGMSVVTINITTETAELRAQAYRQDPERWIEERGAKVEPDDPRQAAMKEALRRADVGALLLEADRIVGAVGACVVKVRWSMVEGRFEREERPEGTPFWPSCVLYIPDHAKPGALWAAKVVLFHLDSVVGEDRWELWTRDEVVDSLDEEGTPEPRDGWWWGRFALCAGRGKDGPTLETLLPMQPYELPDLPAVVFSARYDTGRVFPAPDRDLLHLQDEFNVAMSDQFHRLAYEAHRQIYITGDENHTGKRVGGPAMCWDGLANGATVGSIPSSYDNLPLEGLEQVQVMHARANRMPLYGWWTKDGNPETGVAMRIRTEHSDEKRDEQTKLYKRADEELCRLIARVSDKWGDLDATIDGPGVRFVTKFPPPRRFEDENQKQQRLKQDRDDGIISDARYAVLMEHYENEDEAATAGLSRIPKAKPKPVPPREAEEDDDERPPVVQ